MAMASYQHIRESILARIQAGEWSLGELIPGEVKLSKEYGCARATVNRALRALADEGLVIRKRKEGTRICRTRVRQAKLYIPIVREQVEATGQKYHHNLITQKSAKPPPSIRNLLQIPTSTKALYLETVHLADERPFAYETRWLNVDAVPNILQAPFDRISVNEWLVQSVPFSNGDVAFSAVNADQEIAAALDTRIDQALFLIDRTTWLDDVFITTMKLFYKDGFQLYSEL
ncbi:MAG: UTRA domain-containing protein [Hyphomonadaceae bacterium]